MLEVRILKKILEEKISGLNLKIFSTTVFRIANFFLNPTRPVNGSKPHQKSLNLQSIKLERIYDLLF